ncbi:MAG: PHP domain-containing protein [Bacteroidetes bacterium]|nr:PHP domain-containing protein [Bacteroidota bacterium]MBU1678048.1 PHP domain-containing protein [Bacteroidota bacterium]MBU2507644.1 PHP domain-containing protein [Bacteroidota bacterium]
MLKADLHLHTYHSDGVLSPIELLDKSKDNGIDCISITDHDSVNGIAEAIEYGKKLGIEVIPGLELSTDIEDREVHLLAYFVDIDDLELTKYLSFFRDERFERAKRIVKKLNKLGIDITIDHVLNESKNSSIGRPHVALAMIRLGVVSDYYEAFQKYLRDNGPAYERKIHLSPQSALKLISDSGGLSFIAHPGHLKESVMMNLINTGIDGIEVIHPSHNDYQINFYRGIVNQYCLLESGGSDFHGGKREDESNFGKYSIPQIKVEAMKNMLHNRE